ncbi:MAG: cytochrome c biogenesis protein [Fidelibacterota bacterium]
MIYETYLLLAAAFSFLIALIFSINLNKKQTGRVFIFLGIALQLLLLILRSYYAKHPPFTNLYETMILLPFLFSLRLIFWKDQVKGNIQYGVIGIILLLDVIAIMMPEHLKIIKPLMPALNSFWMYIHVPAYFIAYASMLVATILAILLLARKDDRNILSKKLDGEVKIAFFFLNAGMITGAIWAYFSWGTYWGWDPKEVWSLINILVLSYYFHLNKRSVTTKAGVVIITLLTIIFTYIGVTFILPGLHSYT